MTVGILVFLVATIWRRGWHDESIAPPETAISSDLNTEASLPTPLLDTAPIPRQSTLAEVQQELLNPDHDGWTTESFAALAQDRIEELVDFTKPLQTRAAIGATSFQSNSLRPQPLKITFEDKIFVVRQAKETHSPLYQQTPIDRAIRQFEDPFSQATDRRVAVKTIHVDTDGPLRQTTHILEASGTTATGRLEQHAKWNCEWTADTPPRLHSLASSDYVESHCKLANATLMSDDTENVLGHTSVFNKQLKFGLNHWLQRIETHHGMYVFAEYGLSLGDVNGDGHDDLYVCQPGGLPNRLLVRQTNGRMKDITHVSNTGWLEQCSSSLFVDLDNDGDQDLAVALESRQIIVMQNDGTGLFETAAQLELRDRHVQNLSAVDFDNDGKLDLYITLGFANAPDRDRPQPFIYHDANDGGRNLLFRNMIRGDDWSFEDVTTRVGLDVNNHRHSLAASWEDYDNDGDQDLYVANDYGQNCLYRNDNGSFVEIAEQAGVIDFGSGMSVSWSDYDNDGNVDLYVGNMFSAAGNRISRQPEFQPKATPETRKILSRFAKGNTLFKNLGNGLFSDVEMAGGAELGRWAWSSVLCDLTNDGRDDIVVANGYITTDDNQDL